MSEKPGDYYREVGDPGNALMDMAANTYKSGHELADFASTNGVTLPELSHKIEFLRRNDGSAQAIELLEQVYRLMEEKNRQVL